MMLKMAENNNLRQPKNSFARTKGEFVIANGIHCIMKYFEIILSEEDEHTISLLLQTCNNLLRFE